MRFTFVSVSEQKTVTMAKGNERVTLRNNRLECDFDIEEVEPDGSFWAKYTYRRAVLKLKAPGVNVEYDSDANQPKIPPEALVLRLMLGEEFYVNITPQGRVKKVNGLQAIVSSIKGKIPLITGRDEFLRAVDMQFVEIRIRSQFEDLLAIFPDACTPGHCAAPDAGRIAVGDSWSRTERREGSDTVTQRSFRLGERRPGGIAVIDVNLVVRTLADANGTAVGGVEVKREVSGTGTGRIEVNESTGRIINYTLTQDFVEQVKLSAQGPVLRLPHAPAPTKTHTVTIFEMIERPKASPKLVPQAEPNSYAPVANQP